MNIAQIEKNLTELVSDIDRESFIYELLLAYGVPKATVSLLKKGKRNLSKSDDTTILKKKMYFKEIKQGDLYNSIDTLKNDDATFRHDPRFIVVTDYKTLLAIDTKTNDPLDIKIEELVKHPFFFGPWAKIERAQHANENPADVEAAEKMAKIYDEILRDNEFETKEDLHSLNIFLSRLLFCFFAEDTGIFEENAFTNAISSHTQYDGSDLQDYLNKLFEVLNTQDRDEYPEYMHEFPYVNGGLFGDSYNAPSLSSKSRKMIIECGELDWQDINPDIFGSMFQAVVHTDQRSNMGMHYTSVPNIMKVIEPLFLNELREEFDKHYNNKNKLEQLLSRLEKLRIFDPACGSGNFLIIAYKEIRTLEMEIFQRLQDIRESPSLPFSRISLSQFYGIELDDFAHEVAILSLWLAEHQMNVAFKSIFGQANPTLPLKEGGKIVCANATRVSWADVCPKDKDFKIYVLGNPPYSGSKNQTASQKDDIKHVLRGISTTKSLDYIACWFIKAISYIDDNSCFAFVSTNSLFQGTQVPLIWPIISNQGGEIMFSYKSFLWTNNAKSKAGVTCSIVGIKKGSIKEKIIYEGQNRKIVKNITPYLFEGRDIFVKNRSNPLSELPKLQIGNEAYDCGHLTFTDEEKIEFVKTYPSSEVFFKKIVGSSELIRGYYRWCLWINSDSLSEANKIKGIEERILRVKQYREEGGMNARSCAHRPYQFRWVNRAKKTQIVLPVVSSERREYIPMAFIDKETIIINSAQVIFDPEPYIFGILNSKIHMSWVKVVGGKLKSDYRYNAGLCYNTFPVPDLTETQKKSINTHVLNILEARENYSDKTLAELYDPNKMPTELKEAHTNLDVVVELCYRSKPFTNDEERLECLFKIYEELTAKDEASELL